MNEFVKLTVVDKRGVPEESMLSRHVFVNVSHISAIRRGCKRTYIEMENGSCWAVSEGVNEIFATIGRESPLSIRVADGDK